MKICIVGGIFGKPPDYRATVSETPETLLRRELEQRGHIIEGRGHGGPFGFAGFDVVHVHHLSYGAMAAASDSSDAPFVFTAHWLGVQSRFRRAALRYVIRRADATVALSQLEAAWQRQSLGAAAPCQHVIPNGIDAEVFTYSAPPRDQHGCWKLLYVGQLSRFKGVNLLLEAVAKLRESYRVELSIVHHAGTEHAALREQARELGLTGVHFLGPLPPKDLSKLYARSHLLVLPSIYGEALPSVISEAMLTGRPVVATDVGGVREQLHGFGRIVPPGDPDALAQGLADVMDAYAQYVARSHEMSATARRRYSIVSMVDAHEQLYASLAQAGACTRHTIRRKLGTTAGQLVFPFSLRLVGGGR